VELNQTRHAQIADAVTQLARVGTTLLGAVVVPRSAGTDRPENWSPSPASPPAYQTEAWIGGRSAALDGPTRKLERLNPGRSTRGRVGSAAVETAPPAAHRTTTHPSATQPATTEPTATDRTATDRTDSPPKATNAP
jgi:hypothetical protein